MSGNQPYDPRSSAGWDDAGCWPLPVTPRQVRIKFVVFAALSLLAPVLGLPARSQVALLVITATIPAAVALRGGRRLLGALLAETAVRGATGSPPPMVRPARSRRA